LPLDFCMFSVHNFLYSTQFRETIKTENHMYQRKATDKYEEAINSQIGDNAIPLGSQCYGGHPRFTMHVKCQDSGYCINISRRKSI
jgi:hypothetical protein